MTEPTRSQARRLAAQRGEDAPTFEGEITRAYLPALASSLKPVEVYVYYDRPLLFVGKDARNALFLVVMIGDDEGEETWLYAPISPERHEEIRSGAIDFYTAFREAGTCYTVTVKAVRADTIPPEHLPVAGERLKARP